MPATFELGQDNGAATGSPAKGTTRTVPVTTGHWRGADLPNIVANPYTSSPVAQGANSFDMYLFAKWSGTWNTIGNVLWAHTSVSPSAGVTINGLVSSVYNTPAATLNAALTTNMTAPVAILSGAAVLLSGVGPEGATPVASIASTSFNPIFSQYLITQALTSASTPAGSIGATGWNVQYDEQ